MERISQKTNTEIQEPATKPAESDIETKSDINDLKAKFETEWNNSPFSDETLLDQISQEVNAIEKDYEYSAEDLEKMEDIIRKMISQKRLLKEAIEQNYSENIKKLALKTMCDLAKMANQADPDSLIQLRKLILQESDSIIQIVDKNLAGHEYAKTMLAGIAGKKPDQKDRIIRVLKKYEKFSINKDLDIEDIEIMGWLLRQSETKREIDKLSADFILAINEHFILNPNDFKVLLACVQSSLELFQELGNYRIFQMLKKYEFTRDEVDRLIQKWQFAGGSEKYMPEAFLKNIRTIEIVEKERPGISKFLISKFGIYNFGRYSTELLIKNYDEYENQELPYGVVMFAEDDHNGAYFEYKEELDDLAKSLNGKYILRIAEVGGKQDLLRLLVRLRLKYGEKHKISFGVLGAHGNMDVITLGNVSNTGDRDIRRSNIKQYGNRRYKLFEDNGTLVLLSCESGKKGAIGEDISEAINTKTIAPKGKTGLKSIKAILEEGGNTEFSVKFSHHVRAATFRPNSNGDNQI